MKLLKRKFLGKYIISEKLMILLTNNIIYDVYYTINENNKLFIIANVRYKETKTNIFIEIIGDN